MNVSSPSPATLSPLVHAARVGLIAVVCGLLAWLPYLQTAEETEIVAYSAPKEAARPFPSLRETAGAPARLWGAIIPRGANVWFFKVLGPPDAVVQHEPALVDFLKSVRFEGDQPTWTPPSGWQQQPSDGFRLATLMIPTDDQPLELAVSKLGRGEGPWEEQLLANVNRWRGQVSLPDVKPEELADATQQIPVDGSLAVVVSIAGIRKPDSMSGPPFARGR
jgi:hypothetical protein